MSAVVASAPQLAAAPPRGGARRTHGGGGGRGGALTRHAQYDHGAQRAFEQQQQAAQLRVQPPVAEQPLGGLGEPHFAQWGSSVFFTADAA